MSQFKQLKCEIKCFHTLLDSLQEKDKNSLLLILRSEMSEEDWSKFGGEWGMGNGEWPLSKRDKSDHCQLENIWSTDKKKIADTTSEKRTDVFS